MFSQESAFALQHLVPDTTAVSIINPFKLIHVQNKTTKGCTL